MAKKSTYSIFLITITLISTACSILSGAAADDLDGTQWELLYLRKSTPEPGSRITIQFTDGQVQGNAGCNTFFGAYKTTGNEISFSQLVTTEMACLEPEGIMRQEQEFLRFLSEIVNYSVEGERLILSKTQQDQLTFDKNY
ncbi:MAG TPA: hypothetical protein DCK95_08220 [Anaerolineaceae bacterium]|nr:hypothetical protein [Anaerolineaceae bacterium]